MSDERLALALGLSLGLAFALALPLGLALALFLPLRNTRLNDEFIVRIFIQTSSEEM